MKWDKVDGTEALVVDGEEASDLTVVLAEIERAGWKVEHVRVGYAGCGTHEIAFTHHRPT